jgi:hypothetical protein
MSNNGLIEPRTVYHISTGAQTMNSVDASEAVGNHPREWSFVPWTQEVVDRVEANLQRIADNADPPPFGALKRE